MAERPKTKPRRRARHELLALAPVAAVAAAMFALFPSDAKSFRARRSRSAPAPSGALVRLDAREEAAAMEMIRSSLSVDPSDVRELHADLSISTVADEPPRAVSDASGRARPRPVPSRVLWQAPLPPSLAAPPVSIDPLAYEPEPPSAFPRAELLEIDRKDSLK